MKEQIERIVNECKLKYKRSYITYVIHKVKADENLYKQILQYKTTLTLSSSFLSEVLYQLLNETKNKCCECDNLTNFISFEKGYNKYCSCRCANTNLEACKRTSQTHKGKVSPLKGKTYQEIHGTDTPKCGYQKGDLNIAKQPNIRNKISEKVTASYTEELKQMRREQAYKTEFYKGKFNRRLPNINGELFRSKLEVDFSNLLIENNVNYEYEKVVLLKNKKRKIVDFVIDDSIFIEITGYAYEKWKLDFNKKISWLKEALNPEDFILILTYQNNYDEVLERNLSIGPNVFFGDIADSNRIIKTIQFIKQTIEINKKLKDEIYFKEQI